MVDLLNIYFKNIWHIWENNVFYNMFTIVLLITNKVWCEVFQILKISNRQTRKEINSRVDKSR